MSYVVIGGEDIVLGFSYAGVAGVVAETAQEASAALAAACKDEKVQVVIMEDRVAEMIADEVKEVRFNVRRPVVVEVAGMNGPSANREDLMKVIREAVGIKL